VFARIEELLAAYAAAPRQDTPREAVTRNILSAASRFK
jgi:hypothetical protein